ncbi:tripartite tricarboxylate transporter substrate binding protein [Pseudolabrys sp. FHR47]|uniref:Bug family tripartite tricarboxylate transporter substrate binding protein n=1 Tax=Pseudolabrys sp. FHR47 TaxID=2562284 RepID=UPI0010BEE813|nr:tripartite tricarboxylate transporter substrate binding protein [Pseudolabrys sp. FHR47]
MRKLVTAFAAGLVALSTLSAVSAQEWPTAKPVVVIVPFPPGGSTDSIARVLANKLQEKLGGSFVVQNNAGAGGTIGATTVKRAAPDGYTIFVSSLGPLVIGPHLMKSVPYDALKDFDYITVAVQAPNVLVVPASSPYKSLKDVVADLQKNPGKMSFASSGNGSSDHLTAELFWQEIKAKGTHVAYKGGAPAIQDLLGGQVDSSFQNINAVISHIKSGRLRALSITSAKRSPQLPDVPTMEEQGFKGVTVTSWQAVAMPKGTAPNIKKKLYDAIAAILAEPAVSKPLVDVGFEVVANTPEQFAAFQASEFNRWKKVIEAGNITAE